MPIDYQRDDSRRLVTVTLTDPFTFDELLSQTDRQWADGIWEYAVLYDSRASQRISPSSEIQQMVNHMRVVGESRVRGSVGVAVPARSDALRSGLQLVKVSGSSRDIEILLNAAQVESWLMRHAPRRFGRTAT